jgi:hypothetical protein
MSESLSLKKSLDSVIYKVKRIVNGSLNTIYVFNAKKEEAKLVEPSEKELFKEIFSDREAEQIQSEGIKVVFSDQKIHSDDSIGTIKIKIINEFKSEISLDEIYLYCQKMETLNAVSVYQSLTQNGKLQLTKVRLDQFISNIVCDENGKLFEKPTEKEVYTFDDLFEMKFDNKEYLINNVYIYEWESDFFSVSESGYIYEVEIKISRGDFKDDFNKTNKHILLESNNPENFKSKPNKFFYAAPRGLLISSMIPEYAGFLEVDPQTKNVTTVKDAPFLHKEKGIDLIKDILIDKFYFRYRDLLLKHQEYL